MEKKEYVTPSIRWKDIETSEFLLGSVSEKPGDAPEQGGGEPFDGGAKQNFGGSAWSDEEK